MTLADISSIPASPLLFLTPGSNQQDLKMMMPAALVSLVRGGGVGDDALPQWWQFEGPHRQVQRQRWVPLWSWQLPLSGSRSLANGALLNPPWISPMFSSLWWTNIAMENGHRNSGFSHWKWWFSIAMLVHQRVVALLQCYALGTVVSMCGWTLRSKWTKSWGDG